MHSSIFKYMKRCLEDLLVLKALTCICNSLRKRRAWPKSEEDNIYREIMYMNINDIIPEFPSNYLLTCNAQIQCLEINEITVTLMPWYVSYTCINFIKASSKINTIHAVFGICLTFDFNDVKCFSVYFVRVFICIMAALRK